jgi:hypothetical protein
MAVSRIKDVFFKPPLAIARVGGSDKPLDAFVWATDKSIHGANRTVIRPDVTLKVLADGTLRPYKPNAIQFRDGNLLRPVAPFFELWATVESDGQEPCEQPLTVKLLEDNDIWLDSVEYTVTVANRKAQRRTGSAACAFIARIVVSGDDHDPKPLNAFSPRSPDSLPLVSRDQPIPLGQFRVIRPIKRKAMDVDLSVLRVRFTPAIGEVYGPRSAIAGPASPLPPGEALPSVTLGGRLHDIVLEKNRILSPNTPWSTYAMDKTGHRDPQPSDSYDGANVGDNLSWGVVDDTCDGIIEAEVVIKGQRYLAKARVLSSCPDFAPDRRPFNSLADDLADRDKGPVRVDDQETTEKTAAEIADLFERAFETASLMNLDALRDRGLRENVSDPDWKKYEKPPYVGFESMTGKDRGYARLTAQLFPRGQPAANTAESDLPYADLAHFAHGPLCDTDTLLTFLRDADNAKRVRRLIRPPFGRLAELVGQKRPHRLRDPRTGRDGFHDMRMPPYMRDSDQNALSITHRQYNALMKLLDQIAPAKAARKKPAAKAMRVAKSRPDSPIARQIERFVERYRRRPK